MEVPSSSFIRFLSLILIKHNIISFVLIMNNTIHSQKNSVDHWFTKDFPVKLSWTVFLALQCFCIICLVRTLLASILFHNIDVNRW